VTEAELEELITDCPTLYHMAEVGSWASIKKHGLMSTSALLDLYKVAAHRRSEIESCHRKESVEITAQDMPRAIIRDQKPMDDNGLRRCLPEHLSPADWYELLNSKTFFWLTEDRLHRLTGAKAYREKEHDVLEVDTRSLIEAYRNKIWFCPINSGCTKPMPRWRDETIFARIDDYDYEHWVKKKRKRGERVVELVVDYAVPDIANHIKRVVRKRGVEITKIIT